MDQHLWLDEQGCRTETKQSVNNEADEKSANKSRPHHSILKNFSFLPNSCMTVDQHTALSVSAIDCLTSFSCPANISIWWQKREHWPNWHGWQNCYHYAVQVCSTLKLHRSSNLNKSWRSAAKLSMDLDNHNIQVNIQLIIHGEHHLFNWNKVKKRVNKTDKAYSHDHQGP
jgi:hypothetical protein